MDKRTNRVQPMALRGTIPLDRALDELRRAHPRFFAPAPPGPAAEPGPIGDAAVARALAFRVLILARRRVPLDWHDLHDAALGLHIVVRVADDLQLAALSFPDQATVRGPDVRVLAHAIAHAFLHTWKTGIWICHPDDPSPEERQAEAFARDVLGEDDREAAEKPPQTR